MNEQQRKRLVSRKRYFQVEGKFLSLIILGTGMFGVGLLLFLATVVGAVFLLCSGTWYPLFPVFAGAGISLFLLVTGVKMLMSASEVEKVEVLTPQNAHRLPVAETLVRPSDLPPSQQPAELLRAARQEPETPPEQLLRAADES